MITKEEIKNFIVAEILEDRLADDLTYDLNLIELNILDSLGVMKLITYVEEKCGLVVEIDDLDFEQISSIDGIYAYLTDLEKR